MKTCRNLVLSIIVFVLAVQLSVTIVCAREAAPVDQKRNRLIGYMISKQLPSMHFSDKVVDDELALAAFGLYIKQLDYQKRFLLKQDVEQLEAFAAYIDDNLRKGTISLPDAGYDIISQRISQVEKMVEKTVAGDFQFNTDESYEMDPEKLDYANNLSELADRWQKILRAQVITRYLDLEEDQQKLEEKKSEEELWREAKEKVAKRNRNFFHRLHQETLQDHYDRFFNAVTRAFDPHTNYIPPADKEQFDINMRGSLEGIGALLREEDGYIKVVRIIPGSASARQGRLEVEDIILQVAEGEDEPVDVTDMRLRDAVRLIRGPKGTEVRLTVRKSDGVKNIIPIIRDVVQIEETFVKSAVLDGPGDTKFGYILIPSFYRDFENGSGKGRNSSDDTREAILSLKAEGVNGIVLDLRNNGGGALVDAVAVTGFFIDHGPVVQVKNSYGVERILRDQEEGMLYDGPLVVLVNKFSASASEIVAGALQDYHRAVIVGGSHTHGKGTVQTIVDLNENIPLLHLRKYEDLGALKVMIQKFYRVTGGSTQYKGVEPDIVLPSLLEHLESGERYLEYSLPWDSIAPVDYSSESLPVPLKELKGNSRDRVQHDDGLNIIREEAGRAKERSKITSVSLNIDDMRKKREEARLTREKVGAHYRKYREEQEELENHGADSDGISSDEGKDGWLEDVKDDPYVREAAQVLKDM